MALAEKWKQNKREKRASRFDEIAAQIEAGELRITSLNGSDVSAGRVALRLRGKARAIREGEPVPVQRYRYRSVQSAFDGNQPAPWD